MLEGYTKDILLAIVFFLYPFLLLLVSKGLEGMGVRKDTCRKFVHAAMGLVVLFIQFFDHTWIALIPPLIFTVVNLADLYFGIFSQIQGEEKGNVGTVLYPISYIILIWIFHQTQWWGLAVLGILTMAFGDAAASIIGRKYGKTTYLVNGEPRSYAGSAAMFIVTFILSIIILIAYGNQLGIATLPGTILASSIFISLIATSIEALSIKGTDNLTVPLFTALAAWILFALFMPNVMGNQNIVNQPLYGK